MKIKRFENFILNEKSEYENYADFLWPISRILIDQIDFLERLPPLEAPSTEMGMILRGSNLSIKYDSVRKLGDPISYNTKHEKNSSLKVRKFIEIAEEFDEFWFVWDEHHPQYEYDKDKAIDKYLAKSDITNVTHVFKKYDEDIAKYGVKIKAAYLILTDHEFSFVKHSQSFPNGYVIPTDPFVIVLLENDEKAKEENRGFIRGRKFGI